MAATLKGRLLRSTIAIVVAVVAAFGVASGSLFARAVRDEATIRLGRDAETLAASIADRLIATGALTDVDLAAMAPRGDALILKTDDGLVATTPDLGTRHTISVTVTAPDGAVVTLIADGRPLDRRVHRAWLLIALTAVAITIAAAGLALLAARRLSRPLTRLAAAAAQLGAGDFTLRAPRADVVEMDAIAAALDASAHQIATLMRAEREFSANASHQLRSPLTAIALRLEFIAAVDDPVSKPEALTALDELHDLDGRIDELLRLARTGRAAEAKRFDVAALVRHHADSIRPRFERQKRAMSVEAPPRLDLVASPGAVGQALEILLDNALQHGRGEVRAAVRSMGDTIDIEVRDAGSVDSTGPSAVAAPGKSHGVGLILARNLLRGDKGSVELTNRSPTTFVIRLPAPAPEP